MNFDIYSIDEAPEESKPLLKKANEKFGMVPNLLGVLAESPATLETYLTLGKLLEKTAFTPEEQELLILAISVENNCQYCVAAHSTTARKQLDIADEVIDAIQNGAPVPDKKIDALVTYANKVIRERGFVGEDDIQTFLDAGYTKRHLLEVNLALAMKTLSNYTNHLAETPVDKPFEAEKKEFDKVNA